MVTDEALERIANQSVCISDVVRSLDLAVCGSSITRYSNRLKKIGFDFSKFDPWSKNKTNNGMRKPIEEFLVVVDDPAQIHGCRLKRRLFDEGVKDEKCEWCGLADWREQPISLQMDHINGDRRDWRLDNLRILCPNCHSQTETHSKQKDSPATSTSQKGR